MSVTREEGFSLLEVIAAVSVLAIIMLPVYSMFGGGAFAVLSGRYYTTAATLAQDGMEDLKGRGYSQLRELMGGRAELNLEENLGFYSRKVALKVLPLGEITAGGDGEIILIHITVAWRDGKGGRSVSLTSFLGKGLRVYEKES